MNIFFRVAVLIGAIFYTVLGNAASVSNFQSTYDVVNNRIQYSFDLIPVDGATPSGVDHIYLNYNPQNPPNPFITGTTTLLDSSIVGMSLSIFDVDELFLYFSSPLTSPATVVFILGDTDPASLGAVTYNLGLVVNTTYGSPPSTLGQQDLGIVETDADYTTGTVPPSISLPPVTPPVAATPVPTMSAYGVLLTILGMLLVASRRLRASANCK